MSSLPVTRLETHEWIVRFDLRIRRRLCFTFCGLGRRWLAIASFQAGKDAVRTFSLRAGRRLSSGVPLLELLEGLE